ncbi:hypothetical protein PInf_023338 [Phytophthora infestans]|nr:hypothetical protein PInf_023338 [Phytophthora infestans]
MDEALNRITPKKEPKRRIQIPIPTVQVEADRTISGQSTCILDLAPRQVSSQGEFSVFEAGV